MLKNRKQIGASLSIDLVRRLKDYSEKTMIPISRIMEKAIDTWLQKMEGE